MHDALSKVFLTQQQHDHVETIVSTHLSKLYIQMIELAALCLGVGMVLAIIVVVALRV